jgi:phosphatidylserine/phosphatidylglycerophosphate/cardiolipin synthase-like enzyme
MKRSRLILVLVAILIIAGVILLAGKALPAREKLDRAYQTASPFPSLDADSEEDWYQVYFTEPGDGEAMNFRGGPDSALAEAIRRARLSVDLAIYELDLWSVRDALKDAYRNGVLVRVVTESDNRDNPEIQALVEEGIPVVGDEREGLMHDKFAILDRREVWTGSLNLTTGSAYRSNNNLLRIRSPELAENYLVEFEEMFTGGRFGPDSPANTPNPVISIGETRLETYFSPEDGTEERLVALIRGAQESVYFLAYSFTSDEIGSALLDRARAGVEVTGVLDESQARTNSGGEYDRLREAGLDVFLDGNPENMHHKVILIDEQVVVTGSYNFSASADERNDENTLIVHDPQVAALYRAEFEKVLAEASR